MQATKNVTFAPDNRGAASSQKQTQAASVKEIHVPVQLNAGHAASAELKIPKGLGDETFQILIATKEGISFAATVHHPIGLTDLDGRNWVITPVEDVTTLLARAEHPAQARINAQLKLERDAFLLSQGLTKMDGEKTLWPHEKKWVDSETLFETAKAAFEEAKKSHKAAHDEAQKDKPKAAKYRGFPGSESDFLPDWAKAFQNDCNTQVKESGIIAALRKQLQDGYTTNGGPLGDRPQVAIDAGSSQRKMIDVFITKMMIHDEFVFETPKEVMDETIQAMQACLRGLEKRRADEKSLREAKALKEVGTTKGNTTDKGSSVT